MSSELETNIVSVERVKEYSETPTEVNKKRFIVVQPPSFSISLLLYWVCLVLLTKVKLVQGENWLWGRVEGLFFSRTLRMLESTLVKACVMSIFSALYMSLLDTFKVPSRYLQCSI